jgi:hypothetical protein
VASLLELGGVAIISTPHHGYLKNLALAVTGKIDDHFTSLWDRRHIKFWSKRTLTQLFLEAGFGSVQFEFAVRFYPFSKSMIAIVRRPLVDRNSIPAPDDFGSTKQNRAVA